jgi:hypothetical protein
VLGSAVQPMRVERASGKAVPIAEPLQQVAILAPQ